MNGAGSLGLLSRGIDVHAVENFDEGIGGVVDLGGLGGIGEAANSAWGVAGSESSGTPPRTISIGVKTNLGIFGDWSGTWLIPGAADRWDGRLS